MWVDVFNGTQLTIVFIVILQTMMAHSMVKYGSRRGKDFGFSSTGCAPSPCPPST